MTIRSSRAFFSFEETRLKLEITEEELVELAANGALHAIGRTSKFACEEVLAYLENRTNNASASGRVFGKSELELEPVIDPVHKPTEAAKVADVEDVANSDSENKIVEPAPLPDDGEAPVDIELNDFQFDDVSIVDDIVDDGGDEIDSSAPLETDAEREKSEAVERETLSNADTTVIRSPREQALKAEDFSVKITPKNDDIVDDLSEITLDGLDEISVEEKKPPIKISPKVTEKIPEKPAENQEKPPVKIAPQTAAKTEAKGTTVSQQKDQSDHLESIDLDGDEIEAQSVEDANTTDTGLPTLEDLDPDEIGITIDDAQETTMIQDHSDKMDLTLREYDEVSDKPAVKKQASGEAPSEEEIKNNSKQKSARIEPKRPSAKIQLKKPEPEPEPVEEESEEVEELVDEPEATFIPLSSIPQQRVVMIPPQIGDLESAAWRGLLVVLVILMLYPAFLLGFNVFFDVTDSEATIPVGAQKFIENRRPGEKPLINVGEPYVPSMFRWVMDYRLYDNKLIYEYLGTRKTDVGGERGFDKFVKYEDRVKQGQVKNLPKEIALAEPAETGTTAPLEDSQIDDSPNEPESDDYTEGLF